jgi:(p)ppGpp synthase/HD superfamily hydrolase
MHPAIDFHHVQQAASFAARAHEGHVRKDDMTPYASHPFRVCLIVRQLFGFDDPRMLCAALLHDTVEDTKTDFDDLAEKFSPEVAEWVGLLTKDKRLPDTKREKAYVKALQGAPWQVQVCKLADIYDNLSDLAAMPAEKREKSLERAQQYLEGLSKAPPADLERPLQLTSQLWRERANS